MNLSGRLDSWIAKAKTDMLSVLMDKNTITIPKNYKLKLQS